MLKVLTYQCNGGVKKCSSHKSSTLLNTPVCYTHTPNSTYSPHLQIARNLDKLDDCLNASVKTNSTDLSNIHHYGTYKQCSTTMMSMKYHRKKTLTQSIVFRHSSRAIELL
ncbi:hypothetical protein RND81_04G019800 [Saponaria officinalis]|uniref:Uncharacterized protein n=1 Tax=Saponaria officinalis TaxID=3572 RepID=A0AAW1LI17_SAPOF